MTTRVWFENDAIQMDGIGTVPARSLKTVIDGDRVHVLTLSDVRLSQLVYGEYARKDGSGFASAVAAKAYLDGEFARAVTAIAAWDAVTGKPASYPPSPHAHVIADVTGLQPALDTKQPGGSYAPLSHVTDQNNPHATTKAQVGLGAVDNTSDAAKPISTATQAALNGKAPTSHTHAISEVTGLQGALDGKQSAGVGVSTLIGTVTIAETAAVAILAGVRKVTVAASGVVVGGNYLLFPTGSTPAGYALADVVATAANVLQVTVTVPAIVLGSSYSIPCRLVRINT